MSSERDVVDWLSLSLRLGSVASAHGGEVRIESTGRDVARLALEQIIDPQVFRSAVDHYVAGAVGSMLARSVLWHVHPWEGMVRCHEIFASDASIVERRRAVELLRVVADARVLPWIYAFLADPDGEIQTWGAGIVEQLLFSELVEPEACTDLLSVMAEHPDEAIREQHQSILKIIAETRGSGTQEKV